MKKIILSVAFTIITISFSAQTVNVHFKNGQTIQYNSNNVEYVDFSLKPSGPTLTPGQVVDLGLSVYWASCNLGANKPEEYGGYYAWGETKTKSDYFSDNYIFYNKDTKEYLNIGQNISGTEYDAATVNLGSDWRMPTRAEMQELIDNCTWEWNHIGSIYGFIVTGENGNSIFLPVGGSKAGYSSIFLGKKVCCWTATDYNSVDEYAYFLDAMDTPKTTYLQKWSACNIRPVTSNPNAGGTTIDHSNDHLVTDMVYASFAGGAYSSFNDLINAGSQLMWRFVNGSSESVTLTGIQLINGVTNAVGNNMLSENVEVAAGETKAYTVTVGAGGIQKPKIRFTYIYNQMSYYVEASMSSV